MKKPSSKQQQQHPSSSTNTSNNTNNNAADSVQQSFERWVSTSTSSTSSTSTADHDDNAFQEEPKQSIKMGHHGRARNIANIDRISRQMQDLHVKSGNTDIRKNQNQKLGLIREDQEGTQPSSSKHARHTKNNNIQRPQTSSVIYSSPLPSSLDLTYTPPVFPKSAEDAQFIALALQRNFVFANALSDDDVVRKREMKMVVDAFDSFAVKRVGEVILSKDDVGEYFYIVKEGCVRYYDRYRPKNKSSSNNNVIGLANKPGQSFGELCLLYDCPPPADCVSGPPDEAEVPCTDDKSSSCILWRIHRDTFRQILALRTMRRDKKLREALERVPCFQELDVEYLKKIGDALNPRNVEKGMELYREGDVADTLYLIGTEGQVCSV